MCLCEQLAHTKESIVSCDPYSSPCVHLLNARATHRINAYRCCLFGDSASHSMWLSNLIIWLTFSVVVLRYFSKAIPSKSWQLLLLMLHIRGHIKQTDTRSKWSQKSIYVRNLVSTLHTMGFTKSTSVKHLYEYILILELTTTNRTRWWICYRFGCGSQCNVMLLNPFYCDGQFQTNVSLSLHFVSFRFFSLLFFFSCYCQKLTWVLFFFSPTFNH